MKVFYSDQFVLPLPEGHRFPMVKYSMLRAHAPDYLKRVASGTLTEKEVRRIGFPWSERLVERSRRASGGTLGACLAALDEGFAANLAGGTHHAFSDKGEGYCVLNDSAIAAR